MSGEIDNKIGYKLIHANAMSLIKVSKLAALNGEYGAACSLNTLAAEEIIKGILVMIRHFYPEAKIHNYEDVFKSHSIKHKWIEQISFLMNNLRLTITKGSTDLFANYKRLNEL